MIRPTVTGLNPVERNYYPFMITLDKCNGSCNVADVLPTKICVLSEIKDVHDKVFNMIKRKNEVTTLVEHISCDCKCTFDTTTCKSNKKWNNDKCQC